MKYFLKKLIGFSVGPILGAVISFITVPITTFFISPSEFGKASMFSVIQSLIITFIYLGMDQSYTREYHSVKDKKMLFQNAILLPLSASAFLSILIFIFRKEVSYILFDNIKYTNISMLFSLLIVFSIFERFILLEIRMREKAVEYSIFSIFVKITILATTIVLLSLGERSFLTVVYSSIFGQILGDCVLFMRYKNLLSFQDFRINQVLVKRMIIFGVPLVIAASVNNLLNTSGRLFLRGYSSYHELGIYNAALKVANLLQILQTAFTSFWVPTAYRWNSENKELKMFSFVADALLLMMTLVFFIIIIFKEYIIILLSNNYSDSQFIIGLLSISPILYTISETTTLGIVFSRKSYLNIYVSLFSLIPNIILNYLLVPIFGTIGAGIAMASSYIIFCLSRTYFSVSNGFKIEYKKQIFNIFLFFFIAVLNTKSNTLVLLITILLFSVSILSQASTIKKIIEIKKYPHNWDFN
ncbi:oligosaccharide flippase family protein [Enterococcus gallinarum]|uniref:lipopolysaccharide biosynthesis protein n=1 Tax=Enterococcus gallinarum TaxID=1353 RepID=UPI001C1155E2|nr:oligosaccharide flippase family protein [Enterococcus gallinarum]MBU5356978.1 oligosaccharide flippase family protein [Enterococcus gallinarum]MEB6062668.1 oligosaccharide flippase family protein [Enterococcus gallinarum]